MTPAVAADTSDMRRRSGAVALAVALAQGVGAQDDHGDTYTDSTMLGIGSAVPGVLDADDVDVFRLDVAHHGSEVTLRTAPAAFDTRASLTDPSGNEIAAADGRGAFRIETTLDAGTYYVSVAATEVGAYRILGQADHDPGTMPPPVSAESLLGTWAGAMRWPFGFLIADAWSLTRVVEEDGYGIAVEEAFTPEVVNDLSTYFYWGVPVSDADLDNAFDFDYVVMYRGFDILCYAYFFDLVSPVASGGGIALFGDVTDGECDFTDASVLDFRVARLQAPGLLFSATGSGDAAAERRRLIAERDMLRAAAPGRHVPAAMREALTDLARVVW